MGSTVDHTFRFAYQAGFRRDIDADSCTVSAQLLASGTPSGVNLILDGAAATAPNMTQWQPGCFQFSTTGAPFTRGAQYRAFYTATVGGVAQAVQTQDFYAHSEATQASPSPTQHLYTFGQLKNAVRRALGIQEDNGTGNGQEPGSCTAAEIVNDALERVWREHPWKFQMGEPVYFDIVANQSRYQLPLDFLELMALTRPSDRLHRFVVQSWEWIRTRRERAITNPITATYFCVLSDPATDLTGQTRFAVELYPTPPGYLQNGMVLDYKRQYPKLTDDDEIPPFPAGFTSLLKQAVRMEAYEQEDDPRAPNETGKYTALLAKAKEYDGRHRPTNLGSLVIRSSGLDSEYDNPDLHHDPGYTIPD